MNSSKLSLYWGGFFATFFFCVVLLFIDLIELDQASRELELSLYASTLLVVVAAVILASRRDFRMRAYGFHLASLVSLLLACCFVVALAFSLSLWWVLVAVPCCWLVVRACIRRYAVLSGKGVVRVRNILSVFLIGLLLLSLLLSLFYALSPYALYDGNVFLRASGGWFVSSQKRLLFASFSVFFFFFAAYFSPQGNLRLGMSWCGIVIFFVLTLFSFVGLKHYLMGHTSFGVVLEQYVPQGEALHVVTSEDSSVPLFLSRYSRVAVTHSSDGYFPTKNGYVLLHESDIAMYLSQRILQEGVYERVVSLFDLPHVVWKHDEDNLVLLSVDFSSLSENIV